MDKHKRLLGISLPLILILSLSIYTEMEKPQERPSTKRILDNPEDYEDEYIPGMTGKLTKHSRKDSNLILTLEKYGKTYRVKCNENLANRLDILEKGDKITLAGYSHLKNQGYVEAVKIIHRSKERDNRLYLFSYAGLALLLPLIIWNREKLFEVIPIG